ncbi:MAG: TatD family hydrolase [Candidatus Sungbacteria bacterium]|uniref:TatD family hydrolase n=1 Tax=Candidatus Sungiibacteriota bacterium TaxID=2750080 RepID=A0A9D6LTE1_9BACT|nr:TatD family hydrolase [Candidatus Sungbacteria bacterium]
MSNPKLIDSHTHVQFPVFKDDREAVIQRSLEAGIWMINIGTQASTSREAILLAEKYAEGVYASVGFHPTHAVKSYHDEWEKEQASAEVFDAATFLELGSHAKVVSIGECGLDYYRIQSDELRIKAEQKRIFKSQIEVAKAVGKPLIIHCREAFGDLIEILNSYFLIPNSRPMGVVHFFSGTAAEASALMDLGFYIGFGGVITFAKSYYDIVSQVPLQKILLETDAPYVAPVPYRGKRNEPFYIEATAKKLAEWQGVSLEAVAEATTQNCRRLFQI